MSTNGDSIANFACWSVAAKAFIGRVHCTAAVFDNRAALWPGPLVGPRRAAPSAPDYARAGVARGSHPEIARRITEAPPTRVDSLRSLCRIIPISKYRGCGVRSWLQRRVRQADRSFDSWRAGRVVTRWGSIVRCSPSRTIRHLAIPLVRQRGK